MALRRQYSLFLFSLSLPDFAGDLLDRLLSIACPLAHPGSHTAPPVIFLCRPADAMRVQDLQRDVRVRGSLLLPPKLDALLALTANLLPQRANPAMPAYVP